MSEDFELEERDVLPEIMTARIASQNPVVDPVPGPGHMRRPRPRGQHSSKRAR